MDLVQESRVKNPVFRMQRIHSFVFFGREHYDFVKFKKMERRPARVSESQWSILLDFLARNPNLARSRGYNNTARGRSESARLWKEVATKLNAEGSGTSKTPKDWSIYVSNYKSKLKKIVGDINADISGTGGGPARTPESLSDIDSRFLAILGPGFGLPAPQVSVNPLPDAVEPQPSTSAVPQTSYSDVEMIEFEVVTQAEPNSEGLAIIDNNLETDPAPAVADEPSSVPAAAPSLPRQTRQTRIRSRPLAPLDEARRVLSQIEMQRRESDAAIARALDLIGQNLGRLANAAESYMAYLQRQ